MARTKKTGTKYRAIKWYRDSDDTTPVGQWQTKRSVALRDAYADYAPHYRGFYEIESSHGKRAELTDEEYENARSWYHDSMQARDERGVWGNPRGRKKNTHQPSRSAREFSAWVREADKDAYAAYEKGNQGDVVGLLDSVINASYALGRAAVERRYAGDNVDPKDEKMFREMINGRSRWAESILTYMRESMGVAANPSRRPNPKRKAKTKRRATKRSSKKRTTKRRVRSR